MRLRLNNTEYAYYKNIFLIQIGHYPQGTTFKAADVFGADPTCPRICRRFYEDVSAGLFPNIVRNGKYSRDGYTVV